VVDVPSFDISVVSVSAGRQALIHFQDGSATGDNGVTFAPVGTVAVPAAGRYRVLIDRTSPEVPNPQLRFGIGDQNSSFEIGGFVLAALLLLTSGVLASLRRRARRSAGPYADPGVGPVQSPADWRPGQMPGQPPFGGGFAPPGMPADLSRQMPGGPGGGLTPQQAAEAISGRASAMGLQPATARVLAVHDVPIPPGVPGAPPAGAADLTLDVTLPGGAGYSTTTRISFGTPQTRARITTVGATLPVLVNAQRRDQVVIDTSRLPY
jgi:hypothetical protein